MPRLSTTKLTNSRVQTLKPGVSKGLGRGGNAPKVPAGFPIPATYWDSEIRGFGVQVTPNGSKTFFLKYKSPVTNKSGWFRLGAYTGPKSLEMARERARDARIDLDQGRDPKAEDKKDKSTPTVSKAFDRFVKEHLIHRRLSTSNAAERMIKALVLPELGEHKIRDITHTQIQELFQKVSEGWRPDDKKRRKGGQKGSATPIQANRLLAYLSKLFNLAEKWGYRPLNSNPCQHIERNPETKRQRYLSNEELTMLGRALRHQEQAGFVYEVAAIRLLIYMGARVGEILGLTWAQVDMKQRWITLSEHKTSGHIGAKTLPLNAGALSVLKRLERITDKKKQPFVIHGGDPEVNLASLQPFWERLRELKVEEKKVDLKLADVHLHDLRHTYGSVGAGLGLSRKAVGSLLGHTQAQTTERYFHMPLDPQRDATEKIGEHLKKALR